jgi:hypothetical protein
MAQRRMFSKAIVSSAKFIKMPSSTQMLYFHLGMNADDDGVVEAFTVMRMIGSNEDDLKVLVSKGYAVILNDDLVTLILDWKDHNYIRADRKVDSKYIDLIPEKPLEIAGNQMTDKCQTNDGQMSAQVRLGKVSIGKVSIGKDRLGKDIKEENSDLKEIIDFWNDKKIIIHTNNTVERNIKKKHLTIIKDIGKFGILRAIQNYKEVLESDNYYWNHKWNLWDFIQRGADNFVDAADPLNNYRNKKISKSQEISHEENTRMIEAIKESMQ